MYNFYFLSLKTSKIFSLIQLEKPTVPSFVKCVSSLTNQSSCPLL